MTDIAKLDDLLAELGEDLDGHRGTTPSKSTSKKSSDSKTSSSTSPSSSKKPSSSTSTPSKSTPSSSSSKKSTTETKSAIEINDSTGGRTGYVSGQISDTGRTIMERLGFTAVASNTLGADEDHNTAAEFRCSGSTNTQVGEVHSITLKPVSEDGSPTPLIRPEKYIGINLRHKKSGKKITGWYRDNNDTTLELGFYAEEEGDVDMSVTLCHNEIYHFSIDVAPAGAEADWTIKNPEPKLGEMWIVDIVRKDGSRPTAKFAFEVESQGSISNLNIKDLGGRFQVTCTPASPGNVQLHVRLLGKHISGSPLSAVVHPMLVRPGGPVSGVAVLLPQNTTAISYQPLNPTGAQNPQNAINMQPRGSITIQPQNAVTLQPQNAITLQPQSAVSLQPRSSLTLQPQSTLNLQPQNATVLTPQSVSLQPQRASYVPPPSSPMNLQPQNASVLLPQNSSTLNLQPQNATMLTPQQSVLQPQVATTPTAPPSAVTPANADLALANLLSELDSL